MSGGVVWCMGEAIDSPDEPDRLITKVTFVFHDDTASFKRRPLSGGTWAYGLVARSCVVIGVISMGEGRPSWLVRRLAARVRY